MKRNMLGIKTALLLAAAMAPFSDHRSIGPKLEYLPVNKTKRMPLTSSELAHMETLSGREKKEFVKKMREKYK